MARIQQKIHYHNINRDATIPDFVAKQVSVIIITILYVALIFPLSQSRNGQLTKLHKRKEVKYYLRSSVPILVNHEDIDWIGDFSRIFLVAIMRANGLPRRDGFGYVAYILIVSL